jgi:hypothetical protein
MNITEAQAERIKAETIIATALAEFTKNTGLYINAVRCRFLDCEVLGERTRRQIPEVEIEARL